MNEVEMNACGCPACPGASCNCGCQTAVEPAGCACGPQCGCEGVCTPSRAS